MILKKKEVFYRNKQKDLFSGHVAWNVDGRVQKLYQLNFYIFAWKFGSRCSPWHLPIP